MPKYNFICAQCKTKTHKYVPVSVETIECSICHKMMTRELPNTNSPTEVKEIVDPYLNTKWGKDHEAVMRDRKAKYFRDIEIPRLVQTYSIETCLENKWLIYNDKGELVINKEWTPSGQ